jgi:N-acetylneuraminic acid mutarotase
LIGVGGLGAILFYALLGWSASPPIGDWTPIPPAPIPRFEGASAVVEDRLYLFAGYTAYDEDGRLIATDQAHAFDPETGRWQRLADMPYAVTHLNPAVDATDIWFVGGFEGNNPGKPLRSTWKYDVRSNAWSPGIPLPEARGGGALVRVGRRLHYIGGYFYADQRPSSEKHWALDLDAGTGSEWEPRAPLPVPIGHSGVVAVGNEIVLIGGSLTHHPNFIDSDVVQIYDTETDRWRSGAPLPSPRSHIEPGTALVDGRVYVFGGRDNMSGTLSAMETREILSFDLDANRWDYLPGLPLPLRAPTAALIDDKVYVTAGSTFWANEPQTAGYVADFSDAPGSLRRPKGGEALRVRWSGRVRSVFKDITRELPWRVQTWLRLDAFAE